MIGNNFRPAVQEQHAVGENEHGRSDNYSGKLNVRICIIKFVDFTIEKETIASHIHQVQAKQSSRSRVASPEKKNKKLSQDLKRYRLL